MVRSDAENTCHSIFSVGFISAAAISITIDCGQLDSIPENTVQLRTIVSDAAMPCDNYADAWPDGDDDDDDDGRTE